MGKIGRFYDGEQLCRRYIECGRGHNGSWPLLPLPTSHCKNCERSIARAYANLACCLVPVMDAAAHYISISLPTGSAGAMAYGTLH
jgi:hypothetical protein